LVGKEMKYLNRRDAAITTMMGMMIPIPRWACPCR
jgi:hypothetical protein